MTEQMFSSPTSNNADSGDRYWRIILFTRPTPRTYVEPMDGDIDATIDHVREHGTTIAERYNAGLVVVKEDQELLDEPFDQHKTRYDAAKTLKDRLHDMYDDVASMVVVNIRDDQITQHHFAGEALWEEAYATHAGEPAAYLPDTDLSDRLD